MISCAAAVGIKCVNPSKATESPSLTNPATASRNSTTSATPDPYAHPCRVLLPLTASGESEASRLRLSARASPHDPTACSSQVLVCVTLSHPFYHSGRYLGICPIPSECPGYSIVIYHQRAGRG